MTQTIQPENKPWKAGDDVMNTMRDLISKYHPDLVLVEDEIAILFKKKAKTVGDAVIPGTAQKANKLFGVLGEVDYKFIITLGADAWQEMSDAQRIALLDHHLCACRVEENPQSGGEPKCYIQPPDVAFYKDEVERHGFWRTSGVAPTPEYITDLFGIKP